MKYVVYFICLLLVPVISLAQYGSKKKVYDGFSLINNELEETRTLLNKKTEKLYYLFTMRYQKNGESMKVQFNEAMDMQSSASELVHYINNLKVFLIAKCDDKKRQEVQANDTIIKLSNIDNYDDYLTPFELLVGTTWHSPRKGQFTAYELQEKLKNFQFRMDSLATHSNIEDDIELGYFKTFTQFNPETYWMRQTFYEKPLSAVIVYLTKLQLEVRLSEVEALQYLMSPPSSEE